MPPRLAHDLTDMKSEAGRRTVTSGSPSVALALLLVFCALMVTKLIASRPCLATAGEVPYSFYRHELYRLKKASKPRQTAETEAQTRTQHLRCEIFSQAGFRPFGKQNF